MACKLFDVPKCLALVDKLNLLETVSLSLTPTFFRQRRTEKSLSRATLLCIQSLLAFSSGELFPSARVMRLTLDEETALIGSLALFPEGLESLVLTLIDTNRDDWQLWLTLIACSSLLEELQLFTPVRMIENDEAKDLGQFMLLILRQHKYLRRLRLPVDVFLTNEVLGGLSGSSVNTLFLDNTWQSKRNFTSIVQNSTPQPILDSLVNLRFIGDWNQFDVLRGMGIRLPQLRCLILKLTASAGAYLPRFLFVYLPVLAPNITHLYIGFQSPHFFQSEHFEILRALTRLTSLEIKAEYGVDIMDGELIELVSSMPDLEHLHLSPCARPIPRRRPSIPTGRESPTVAGLSALARICINLKTLGLELSCVSNAVIPSSTYFAHLEHLDLGTTDAGRVRITVYRPNPFLVNLANVLPNVPPRLTSKTEYMKHLWETALRIHRKLPRVKLAMEEAEEREVEGLLNLDAGVATGSNEGQVVEGDNDVGLSPFELAFKSDWRITYSGGRG